VSSTRATGAPPAPVAAEAGATPKPSIVLPKIVPPPVNGTSNGVTLHRGEPSADEADGAPPDGILSRIRAGRAAASRPTPFGSAGRVRLPPPAATIRLGAADAALGQSTRGGTPLGAPPKAGVPIGQRPGGRTPVRGPVRSAGPQSEGGTSFPGTPDPTDRADGPISGEIFGTPPSARRLGERPDHRLLPALAPNAASWLSDVMGKAQSLQRSFPVQARLGLSREPNLPFTLVIDHASPAVAVRAMVSFVEFLAGIPVPPRARIDMVGVAHLDRSFHKNVEAALEPYFKDRTELVPGVGNVEIRFSAPDPAWSGLPTLPLESAG
jgi:hypothetical protein